MDDNNLDNKTEKELIAEFVKRFQTLELDGEVIKQGKKDLKEEFKEKIDLKTLDKVIRVLKIKMKVDHKDTFDEMMDQLESEFS